MMPQPTDAAEQLNDATGTEQADESDQLDDAQQDNDATETFPREYVQDLRSESARYREKAKTADQLAQRLHVALVAATGRLADPTDLPFDESHLADDGDALTAAIDELLERKPHLKSRRVVGDVGQGAGGKTADVDLAGILRGLA